MRSLVSFSCCRSWMAWMFCSVWLLHPLRCAWYCLGVAYQARIWVQGERWILSGQGMDTSIKEPVAYPLAEPGGEDWSALHCRAEPADQSPRVTEWSPSEECNCDWQCSLVQLGVARGRACGHTQTRTHTHTHTHTHTQIQSHRP